MKYLFTVRSYVDEDFQNRVALDSFYEAKALGKLDNNIPIESYIEFSYEGIEKDIKDDIHAYNMLRIRTRVDDNNKGPYALEIEDTLCRETMETIIQTKFKDGTLKRFLKQAKI